MRPKGILLGNVTNIILAAIGLAIFIGFFWQVTHLYINQEENNAKRTLDLIYEKVSSIEDGQETSFLIQGFEQKKNEWVFVAWSKNEGKNEGKPDKCTGRNCLCSCKLEKDLVDRGLSLIGENYVSGECKNQEYCAIVRKQVGESCQKSGYCKFLDEDTETKTLFDEAHSYYIMAPRTLESLNVNKNNDIISIFLDRRN